MCYILSEICIDGRFLEVGSYYYSQIITAIAIKSLIPYKNLIKRTPETQKS